MLKIGDRVVYPMHGAGVISAIEECEVLGEDKSYYVLELPFGNMKVMIPTDNVAVTGLRGIIGPDEVPRVVRVLKSPPEKATGSWNKRMNEMLSRMKSGDILDVAAVARNLILRDRVKRIPGGERRLLNLAKQILISELVYAVGKTPAEIEDWIYSILSGNVTMAI